MTYLLSLAIGSAVLYAFLIGLNGSGNVVATLISSQALTPRASLSLAAVTEGAGALLLGTAVAEAIAVGTVRVEMLSVATILAATIAADLWIVGSAVLGLPSSSSHALFGGLIGGVVATAGFQAIILGGLALIVGVLFLAPLVAGSVAFLIMLFLRFVGQWATPRLNLLLRRGQVVTATLLGITLGSNDAQKAMALIALAIATEQGTRVVVSEWIVVVCGASLALGIGLGGWRTIRTLGARMYRIHPIDGFAVQVSAGLVVGVAAVLGGPVSSTHVVGSSIIGAGVAERPSKVRWGVAASIALAWLITMPVTALVAGLIATFLVKVAGG